MNTHSIRTLRVVVDRPIGHITQHVRSPREASEIFFARLSAEPVEVVGVLLLTTRQTLIGYSEVSRGSIDAVSCAPRDVLRAALLANARSVIICHNHPSGDPTPTPDDIACSRRISSAAALLGIDVADFMIVGDQRYFSFKEAGLMAGRQEAAA